MNHSSYKMNDELVVDRACFASISDHQKKPIQKFYDPWEFKQSNKEVKLSDW